MDKTEEELYKQVIVDQLRIRSIEITREALKGKISVFTWHGLGLFVASSIAAIYFSIFWLPIVGSVAYILSGYIKYRSELLTYVNYTFKELVQFTFDTNVETVKEMKEDLETKMTIYSKKEIEDIENLIASLTKINETLTELQNE